MSNKRKLSKCFMVNMIILIFINFIFTSRVLAQWPYNGTYSEPSIENQLYAVYGVSPEGVFIWPWGGRQYPISPYPTTSWIGNQSYNYGGYWPPYGGQAHYGYPGWYSYNQPSYGASYGGYGLNQPYNYGGYPYQSSGYAPNYYNYGQPNYGGYYPGYGYSQPQNYGGYSYRL